MCFINENFGVSVVSVFFSCFHDFEHYLFFPAGWSYTRALLCERCYLKNSCFVNAVNTNLEVLSFISVLAVGIFRIEKAGSRLYYQFQKKRQRL